MVPSSSSPELRPLLVERTIRWRPVESNVAARSVAPGTVAAVEPLVVQRDVMREVESHLRSMRGRAFGVLRGAIYRCPRMRLDYLLVEGVLRADSLGGSDDEDAARRLALAALVARLDGEDGARAVGWYRGGTSVQRRIKPGDVATHAQLFAQPWPVALLREGPGAHAGAFVRLSSPLPLPLPLPTPRPPKPRRPYMVPFHELLPAEPRQAGEPLTTAVIWTNYRTDSLVEPLPELARNSRGGGAVPFAGTTTSTAPSATEEAERPPPPPRRISGRVAPFVPRSATPTSPPSIVDPEPAGSEVVMERSPPAAAPPSSIPSPVSEPAPPHPREPSAVDRLFDDPPPAHLAGGGDSGRTKRPVRRPPRRWPDRATPANWRRRRAAVVVAVIVVALAGTWFVARAMDRAYGLGPPPDASLGDGPAGADARTRSDSAPASANDSTASMATFAAQRLNESMSNLDHELRLVAAALDTSGYGSLAPGACALADSAHTRSLLDLDAIALAQRYLKRPLDSAGHQRVAALTHRADAAGAVLRRVCR